MSTNGEVVVENQIRQKQKQILKSLLASNYDDFITHSLIVVYGAKHTGKTTTTRQVLLESKNPQVLPVFIDCRTISAAQHFYKEALDQLYGNSLDYKTNLADDNDENDIKETPHAQNFQHFILLLRKYLASDYKIYFVLDSVSFLFDKRLDNLINCVLRLPKMFGCRNNIGIILLTKGISQPLERAIAPLSPVYVYFPSYEKGEILEMVQKEFDWRDYKFDSTNLGHFIGKWVSHLYDVFYHECKEWLEFRYIVQQLRPILLQCLNHLDNFTHIDLVRTTKPHVQQLFRNLYHHKENLEDIHVEKNSVAVSENLSNHFNGAHIANGCEPDTVKLPKKCQVLALASYLASFNPDSSDCSFFISNNLLKKSRKRRKSVKDSASIPQHFLGPKPFLLQRLIAIYSSILEEYSDGDDFGHSHDSIFGQLATLTRMQLISRVSVDGELDNVKLRCNVDYEFVESIAKQLNISLQSYLYEG